MEKIAILYSQYSPTIDALKYQLHDYEIDCYDSENNISQNYKIIFSVNYDKTCQFNHIRCHHSLLPSFDCNEPEKEAILNGVKVTGITFLQNNKIIAQYPVFITSDMHYETLKQELDYIEQTLYPIIAEKILKNEPFDIKTILGKSSCCSGGCSGCSH